MRIQLSDHFTYKRLLRFVLPSVMMIICTSVYGIVDGFFVSNYVGKTPFAAVNLIMPLLMWLGTVGFMIGTGGSAIVSKTMGEGKGDLANQYFSMLVWVALGLGAVLSVLVFILIRPIAAAFGAEGQLLEDCVIYGRILLCAMPAFILQFVFQSFFITAEKPGLNLRIQLAAGVANGILDYLFIVVFSWGLAGAALATAAGQVVGGIVPILYFVRKNDSRLRLAKARFEKGILAKTLINGSSEMVTNLSVSIVSILYNLKLMEAAGEDGVAAYGIIMYVNIIFMAVFLGYAIGSAPVVGFHYGAGNHGELRNMFRKSLLLMAGSGMVMFGIAELTAVPLVMIFAGYDEGLLALTVHGFRLYSLSFIMMGVNVWASAFFTALGNGVVSAAISFCRTLVFQVIVIFILPLILGIDGIWLGVGAAELLALGVSVAFLVGERKRYHYC